VGQADFLCEELELIGMLTHCFNSIKIIIVIPVYNHGSTLRGVVTRALKVNDQVMVFDDGSTDGGIDTLGGLNVHIVRHSQNRGKGAAILSAAKAARRLGMTHMITIDADGQHDPFDFRHFSPVLQANPCAVVVGKRNFSAINAPLSARFGRHFSNFWFRLQTGQVLADTQSGFRAYPLAVLEKLKLREKHYAFEVEVLVKAAWGGIKLHDVNISVFYPTARERVSHFHLIRDNFQLSLLNTRLTLRSIFPLPHRQILEKADSAEKISILHPVRSLKKLLGENASAEKLAVAGALGVLLGALPLIACHTIAILFAAGFFRLNKVAALSTSQLCMPPFVPAICIELGYFLRHGRFLTEVSIKTLGYQGLERCYEWLIGSLLLAPILALFVGGIIYLMGFFITRVTRATN
jgi:glycosyltransferase involved in cell wall biosynthesis